MEIYIKLTAGDATEDEVRALLQWIRAGEDDGIGARLVHGNIPEDHLGPLTDSIAVAISSGGAVAALAASVREWLRQRSTDIRLTIEKPNGVSFHLDAKRVDSPEEVLERFRRLFEED
ncbi:effector-associated constant component EACC1 [Polymorphospora rubra]|uniref:Uncharacterized protein n=1 Tax=Polymorphospora rubra TaxID=338584 RepID=A0A810N281_9ACTN|nr:hypothetical protein [Polymorphospora rubra]BCJ67457.1 hypothetical protein Prubr_44780 [Polymorphospora rubra]